MFAWLHCSRGIKVCHAAWWEHTVGQSHLPYSGEEGVGREREGEKVKERRGETEQDREKQPGGREVSQNPL